MESILSLLIEEENRHVTIVEAKHSDYVFQVEINNCLNPEDIIHLYVQVFQKGSPIPVLESSYLSLIGNSDSKLKTNFFSFPVNSGFTPPFIFNITSTVPDVNLSDFKFQLNYKDIVV